MADMFGRHLTFGSAEHPLEAVGMLTMALPIALVGLIHAKRRRDAVLYGLAACVVLAATIATYRKTALLAPLSVGLTLLYFTRGQLLKLAPLALPALVLVHLLSPGAFGSIIAQGENLGVGTVSDRTSDYDALRPDLWSNLAFGRGYGSSSYRILDSEVLTRLVDSGIVGLLFYVLMLVSVLLAARFLIRSQHERWAPYALAVAAATVAFFVLSFLFDVMVFPHTPYALLSLAALLAAMRAAVDDDVETHSVLAPPPDRFRREPHATLTPMPGLAVAEPVTQFRSQRR
jgi:putative inorganic carbon (HCO3(-)) transporter